MLAFKPKDLKGKTREQILEIIDSQTTDESVNLRERLADSLQAYATSGEIKQTYTFAAISMPVPRLTDKAVESLTAGESAVGRQIGASLMEKTGDIRDAVIEQKQELQQALSLIHI